MVDVGCCYVARTVGLAKWLWLCLRGAAAIKPVRRMRLGIVTRDNAMMQWSGDNNCGADCCCAMMHAAHEEAVLGPRDATT